MTNITAEERAESIHMLWSSGIVAVKRGSSTTVGVAIHLPPIWRALSDEIASQIRQAEAVAAKAAREELLQMPTDSVEDIEAYLDSGRPLTGWTKAVWECARRRALEEAAAVAGTLAERPYDSEPEFSCATTIEAHIRALMDNPDD